MGVINKTGKNILLPDFYFTWNVILDYPFNENIQVTSPTIPNRKKEIKQKFIFKLIHR
jgi:hypothetical protein